MWRMVQTWHWRCDGCGADHIAGDEYQPDGWIHTQDGRDLCGECAA